MKLKITEQHIKLIEHYQCAGCAVGSDTKCGKFNPQGDGCGAQRPGTFDEYMRPMWLLPNGFRLIGTQPDDQVSKGYARLLVHSSYEQANEYCLGGLNNKYTVPVWMHFDSEGNTLVRWYMPRRNESFTTVIGGDARPQLTRAVEITQSDIDEMD